MTRLAALAFLLAAAGASAQPVVFDEGDGNAGFYGASDGDATGDDTLERLGPDGRRLPLTSTAFSGSDAGRLTYRHLGGTWRMDVGAPGFAPLNFSQVDSLVLRLNGPRGVAGTHLPSVSLVDAAGRVTAPLALDFGGPIGIDAFRSRFQPGSPTDATIRARYVSSLPADQPRPGYPEALTVTFSNSVLTTSTATIGVPAVPARFRITTDDGTEVAFRFADANGSGTLDAVGEYVDVLLPDAEGSATVRPTWRFDVTSAPTRAPAAGDVYRLVVFNAGVDADQATWQRRALALTAFGPLGDFDRTAVRAVRFSNPTGPFASASVTYTLWFDALAGIAGTGTPPGPPAPTNLSAEAGNEAVVLRWTAATAARGVLVYRRPASGGAFALLTDRPVTQAHFADLSASNGTDYVYVLRSVGFAGIGQTVGPQGPDSQPVSATPTTGVRDPYLDLTQRLAFDYFWEQANPANGMVKDRSTAGSAASVAAVGFGLSAYTVGVERGYVTRAEAVQRTLNTLRFFATCPQSTAASGTCGNRGFFYHFLDMQTGLRDGTNELSTIDTALLLGGILHAAQYYTGASAEETEIRTLADAIYRRVEWDWSTNGEATVALGWTPETGFFPFRWIGYSEGMLIYVLGLGSPTHPLPSTAWSAWTAGYDYQTFYDYQYITFPPLFGHQYSHLYVDFRGIQDDYTRARGLDYFENSRRATLANRAYCIANPQNHPGYGPDEWGLTASDDPFGYQAHGAPPAQADNGTIAPTAAGGSFMFTPVESRTALRHFYETRRPTLWGPYGLKDAFNARENWTAPGYIGIDQGPILLSIENERTGAVWTAFMANPAVQLGLDRAGFSESTTAGEDGAEALQTALLAPAPNPATGRVSLRYTLAETGTVRLDVFDTLGRRVARLGAAEQAAGEHTLTWDTSGVATGVYIVRLDAGGESVSRRLTVAR